MARDLPVVRDARTGSPTKGSQSRRAANRAKVRTPKALRKKKAPGTRGWYRATSRANLEPIPPELRGKYTGKTVIVMGTGPSLADYDLTDPFFAENITIGSNNIGALFVPTYYLLTDPVAVNKYWGNILTSTRSHFLLGELAAPHFARKLNFPVTASPIQYDRADRIGKPGHRIYHGATTGCVMMHVAWLMGAKNIFLIGIDGYGVVGQKHATGNQPVGTVRHDRTVSTMMTLAMAEAVKHGRFLFNMSYRSVYHMVPRFYSTDEASQHGEQDGS